MADLNSTIVRGNLRVTDDINTSGSITFAPNQNAIDFRPNNVDFTTYVAYETNGNEALLFKTKNEVTSFIFANGITSTTSEDEWKTITNPGLQIKNNCVSIGELVASGAPTYKFNVKGTANATTLYENGTAISTTYAKKTYVDDAIAAAITTTLNTPV